MKWLRIILGLLLRILGIKLQEDVEVPDEIKPKEGGKYLLVGINEYPNAPLKGCVNDVEDVKALLKGSYGVTDDQIKVLTDRAATTANIKAALSWLVDVEPGQICYFHYSGHGVQVPIGQQEQDGLSEAICPVDFNWGDRQTVIIDDDLHAAFSRANGARIYWTSDSCHSGDLTRAVVKNRTIPMPPEIAEIVRKARSMGVRSLMSRVASLNLGFVSGCQSDQTSADTFINGYYCGAFSYYFVQTIKENVGATLKQVADKTREKLARNGYTQRPTCEGPRVNNTFLG